MGSWSVLPKIIVSCRKETPNICWVLTLLFHLFVMARIGMKRLGVLWGDLWVGVVEKCSGLKFLWKALFNVWLA